MPNTTTKAPALDRRTLFHRALTGAAGAAIGATAALPTASSAAIDPAMGASHVDPIDPFALGGRQDADAEILMLFREWCAAWRAAADVPPERDCDEAIDAANRIAKRIFDAPVHGVVGLAIKAYMVGQELSDEWFEVDRSDWCAFGPFTEGSYNQRLITGTDRWTDIAYLFMQQHALRGLLASAAAFVPELQPLVARAIESPLTLPLDEEGEVA